MQNIFKRFIFICIIFISYNSLAVRELYINEGKLEAMPIAINSFTSHGSYGQEIASKLVDIIKDDLKNCSFFRLLPSNSFIEERSGVQHRPLFAAWRQINAQFLLNGHVKNYGNRIEVSFILWDPTLEKDIYKEVLSIPTKLIRRAAHKIADAVYEKATGDKGYFDTRVAYISETGTPLQKVKRLAIMDYDGANHKYLTDGKNIVLTPRFSPKADKILYLSYNNHSPRVYLRDLATGKDSVVGDFPGMSFAPKFSSDGSKALMSVARNGATNIIEVDFKHKKIKKLTDTYYINTSPSYSPDGSKIVYNSNRSGSRQLYVMDYDGSNIKRVSFGTGSYATPVWSPRGDFIAFTKMSGGNFYIGVMRPDGTGERIITTGYLVEGPTWSPSGRMIMFTRESKTSSKMSNISKLYMIDLTGHNEQLVPTPVNGSDPEWSNLLD